MTEPISIAAFAVAISTRPGALSILDADAASGGEHRARYWAEPSKIAQAMALLEELGFVIIGADRTGVSFSGRQEALEAAFQVKLSRQTPASGGAAFWQATPAGGGALLFAIPPVTDAQKACLRGVLLQRLSADYVPVPKNSAPEVEQDYLRGLAPTYPYWIMPHQLRRQLSATWRADAEVDAIPRGTRVRVVVVDTGWDPNHPYWEKVNLGLAARKVELAKEPEHARQLAQIQDNLNRMLSELVSAARELRPQASIDPRSAITPEARRRKIIEGCGKAADSINWAYDEFPAVDLRAARQALDNPVASHEALNQLVADLLLRFEQVVVAACNDLEQLRDEPWADSTVPHGTCVVGQLIAVAPEASVIVVRTISDPVKQLSPAFRRHSAYTGLDLNDALTAAIKLRPQILSCSRGAAYHFQHTDPSNVKECAAALKALDDRLQDLARHGGLGVFCAGNLKQDTLEPPFVVAQTRLQNSNLLVVGGAWWSSPDPRPGELRSLSASDYAIGYWEKSPTAGIADIRVPHICGLVGPTKLGAAANDYWGMCFVPFRLRDGSERMQTMSGTSLATPQVAGVAAIVLATAGAIGLPELRRILIEKMAPIPATATADFRTPLWASSALNASAPGPRPGLVDLAASVAEAKAAKFRNARADIVGKLALMQGAALGPSQ